VRGRRLIGDHGDRRDDEERPDEPGSAVEGGEELPADDLPGREEGRAQGVEVPLIARRSTRRAISGSVASTASSTAPPRTRTSRTLASFSRSAAARSVSSFSRRVSVKRRCVRSLPRMCCTSPAATSFPFSMIPTELQIVESSARMCDETRIVFPMPWSSRKSSRNSIRARGSSPEAGSSRRAPPGRGDPLLILPGRRPQALERQLGREPRAPHDRRASLPDQDRVDALPRERAGVEGRAASVLDDDLLLAGRRDLDAHRGRDCGRGKLAVEAEGAERVGKERHPREPELAGGGGVEVRRRRGPRGRLEGRVVGRRGEGKRPGRGLVERRRQALRIEPPVPRGRPADEARQTRGRAPRAAAHDVEGLDAVLLAEGEEAQPVDPEREEEGRDDGRRVGPLAPAEALRDVARKEDPEHEVSREREPHERGRRQAEA
jgi:hypothetical protein